MQRVQHLIARFQLVLMRGAALPVRSEGQTLVEYALILVLVAVVVVAVVATLGKTVKSIFENVASSV